MLSLFKHGFHNSGQYTFIQSARQWFFYMVLCIVALLQAKFRKPIPSTTLTGLMSLAVNSTTASDNILTCCEIARRQLSHGGKGKQYVHCMTVVHCCYFHLESKALRRVQDGLLEDDFTNLLFPHHALLPADTAYI